MDPRTKLEGWKKMLLFVFVICLTWIQIEDSSILMLLSLPHTIIKKVKVKVVPAREKVKMISSFVE